MFMRARTAPECWCLDTAQECWGFTRRATRENFIWTSPALESAKDAKAMYESDDWHNSGGDRTWLTPEVDIFFPDYLDTSRHWAPRQLDASDYDVSSGARGVSLSRQFSVEIARAGAAVNVELSKTVSPAPNPLRYERDPGCLAELQYAGYTLDTSLELVGSDAGAPVKIGLWNLLQMPHGGDLLVPTYSKTKPTVLFGEIQPDNLIVGDNLVRFRIVARGEHKIAVRATATTGRTGYIYRTGDQWALVIRNFNVNPSGEYVDVPKNDLDDLGTIAML